MKTLRTALAFLAVFVACGKPAETPSAATPEVSSASPPTTSPTKPGTGAHETRHGGVLVMTASPGVHLHTEAVLTPAGAVQLFLTDAKGDPIAASEASGTVTCEGAAPTTRTLVVTQDALGAECPALSGPTTLRYQLLVRGSPASGEIKVPANGTVGMAAPEHHPGHAHH